jgi:hypothetical protein
MLPLLPVVGLAVLGVTLTGWARREMQRVTARLDERERAQETLPDPESPTLRRDPQSGQWRPDPKKISS